MAKQQTVAALVRERVMEVLNGLPISTSDKGAIKGMKLKAIPIITSRKGELVQQMNVFQVGCEARIAARACRALWDGGSLKRGDTEWFLNIEEQYDPVSYKPVFAENGNDTLRKVFWVMKDGNYPSTQTYLGEFYKRYGVD